MNLQNPGPRPNTNPYPAHISSTKSLSFDEVSNFFSLPLSDAADSLGVCPSVLKKICLDHGLVRWPHRKFLAGKSVEEIKKAALIQKNKQLAEMPGIAGGRGPEPPNKLPGSVQEMPRSGVVSQPRGSKNLESGNLQNVFSSNLNKGTQANSDEFKYGFPSDGLSTVSYRWWGDLSQDGNEKVQACESERAEEVNRQSEDPVNNSATDAEKSDRSDKIAQETSSLSAIRKRAVKEGKAALKLGVYQGSGVNKLDWNKRAVLLQIFKSSLPNQWEYASS